MTNYETYYPGIEDKDKLAEKLEKLCLESNNCAWCYGRKDRNCPAGRFREWLDEESAKEKRCKACELR